MNTAKSTKNFFFHILCGFFLGISVIAPGVSGSVIAVMMGIYKDLITIISNPFKNFKKNFFTVLSLGIGVIISFALGILFLSFLFDTYEVQAKMLFIGLVAGGLPSMYKTASKGGKTSAKFFIASVIAFIIAAGVGLIKRTGGGVVADNPAVFYVCIACFVAGMCSMVPGMSISMIFMLFGVYNHLMNTAADYTKDILGTAFTLLPPVLCFGVGMILFSKVTKFIFDRFTKTAYFLVFGFMCGTLTAVFPDTPPSSMTGWLACVLTFALGIAIAALFMYLGKRFGDDSGGEMSENEPDNENAETVSLRT